MQSMRKSRLGLKVLIVLLNSIFSTANDTIAATKSLKDGDTIISTNANFELGFFSPGGSTNRYVGIWYKKISLQTVVWVANRDVPLTDNFGKLIFSGDGILLIYDKSGRKIWSSNLSKPETTNPVAQILDSGNLVVKEVDDDNPDNYLWQSFDYPGDTFLPGMKYGMNFVTGLNRVLTSWLTPTDPSTGNYTNGIDPRGVPQMFLKKNSVDKFRSGPWNGLRYSGMPNLKPNQIYSYEYVLNNEEVYYRYKLINDSVISRMQLNSVGALQRYTWTDRIESWNFYLSAEMDNCDRYALCGVYGTCNINNSPACACLKGFVPRSLNDWAGGDWTQGCIRKVKLDCGIGEDFILIPGVKVPDTRSSTYNQTMDLIECKRMCLRNCSCTAYANFDIRGSGCIHWFGDLIDIREYERNGQDIYLRLAASEIEAYKTFSGKKKMKTIIIVVVTIGVMLVFVCATLLVLKKRTNKLEKTGTMPREIEHDYSDQRNEEHDLELPVLDLTTIISATDNFSEDNKIGQGGYGPVYKGILDGGGEIAVKRLSKTSKQGLDEFKNEVKLIAKLQHRNLVKLLGCCIQEREQMLVYEYMPNKSLNNFIFDKKLCMLLDWPRRFNIINGVARGLLYLHQDSRLRIIHRDLKASNVLLDYDMNPKISDFGMARTFGGDETESNTTKVVGTYGYMSPEYQLDGLFSVKSDVFSFGVLVLEIVSSRRNRGFSNPEHKLNLLGHAWRLYGEERTLDLMDESIKESWNMDEVMRAVHVGLLCVQQNPEDRPSMSTVVVMLTSEMVLPHPKEPGFFTERHLLQSDCSTTLQEISTVNMVTITSLGPR